MTPIRKAKNTSPKKSIPVSSQNLFFLHLAQYLRKLPKTFFYCDSPSFEIRVCVSGHLLTSRQLQIILLVSLTKRKNTSVKLAKLKSSMFRPHKLQILLLVDPSMKKNTFVNVGVIAVAIASAAVAIAPACRHHHPLRLK
jgi:hypothetical protein